MTLISTNSIILRTKHEDFAKDRRYADEKQSEREVRLDPARISDAGLEDLMEASRTDGDARSVKAIEAILRSRKGEVEIAVPNFKAFEPMLRAFLKHHAKDGWLYVRNPDGKLYPELVVSISYVQGHNKGDTPSVRIQTGYYGTERGGGQGSGPIMTRRGSSYVFHAGDTVRRRVEDILANRGLLVETDALRAEYGKSMERFDGAIRGAFAKQFRFEGPVHHFQGNYGSAGAVLTPRKVIHDLAPADFGDFGVNGESDILPEGQGLLPWHPLVRVFDLKVQEFMWVHSDLLKPYEYDKSIRDKLILPESHHDLLDILTTDIDAFVEDLVDGKSTGNVILCKGPTGTGKTLTAEAYAEIMERPLYAINAGSLGTTAETISKNLRVIFERAKRWNCVLLLDEADVFVKQRGNDLEQNAIVSEFLRVLEYVDALLFMTTNRPDDIDDAILSRCAAIIDYGKPEVEDMRRIWRVQSDHFGAELSDELIDQLLQMMPAAVARDANRLLRLVLRTAKKKHSRLDVELFRKTAMFRGIKLTEAA